MVQEILDYNRRFVQEKRYEAYVADKYPRKKLAILTCMDTRLTELLPAALGLKNGDAKIIKNAGAVIANPFGSEIRSLLVAIYELGVQEVLVIGHTDCGVQHISGRKMMRQMQERGIRGETLELLQTCGVDFERWLAGFETVEQSVAQTAATIRRHPLILADVRVGGYVMDSVTGAMQKVWPKV